jgi:hypothetical protein
MLGFRRIMVIAALVGAVGTVGLAGQASAQSYAATLSATVVDCVSITVTGTDWEPNADVSISINSTVLGEVETDDDGNFTATFPLNPGLGDGDHVLTATSEFSESSLGITLTGCAAAGRLAVTGSNSFPYVAAGVALILAGAVLATITYRRRASHSINV